MNKKKQGKLIYLITSIIASINRDVDIEIRRVPVSSNRYVHVGYTWVSSCITARKQQVEDINNLRESIIASLMIRGFRRRTDIIGGVCATTASGIEQCITFDADADQHGVRLLITPYT